jgi:hypothetical protein
MSSHNSTQHSVVTSDLLEELCTSPIDVAPEKGIRFQSDNATQSTRPKFYINKVEERKIWYLKKNSCTRANNSYVETTKH